MANGRLKGKAGGWVVVDISFNRCSRNRRSKHNYDAVPVLETATV